MLDKLVEASKSVVVVEYGWSRLVEARGAVVVVVEYGWKR